MTFVKLTNYMFVAFVALVVTVIGAVMISEARMSPAERAAEEIRWKSERVQEAANRAAAQERKRQDHYDATFSMSKEEQAALRDAWRSHVIDKARRQLMNVEASCMSCGSGDHYGFRWTRMLNDMADSEERKAPDAWRWYDG